MVLVSGLVLEEEYILMPLASQCYVHQKIDICSAMDRRIIEPSSLRIRKMNRGKI